MGKKLTTVRFVEQRAAGHTQTDRQRESETNKQNNNMRNIIHGNETDNQALQFPYFLFLKNVARLITGKH